jgi:DNA polymerase III alpha subunit
MVHLHIRTEYSFRRAYGKVEDVLKHAVGGAMAMTDSGTWGHVNWAKACKKAGIRPIFGVELALVPNAGIREKQSTAHCVLLAKTDAGLREIYEIVSLANTKQFFYTPRIDYKTINSIGDDVVVLLGPGTELQRVSVLKGQHYLMLTPSNRAWNRTAMTNQHFRKVVACDNHYPTVDDGPAYEILAQFNKETRSTPMHILSEDELRLAVPEADDDCFFNTERIAAECDAHLPRAENIKITSPVSLYDQCIQGAVERGLPIVVEFADTMGRLADQTYHERLLRELDMIQQKQFEDYFFLVGDLVRWAKTKMLVGPARGSSAGSLVCYLLNITDVDPLVHDLMFERFIDITRADLPDIDIDFQDVRRDMVIEYLRNTYGADQVGRIGTVARLKAKSCLGDVAKELGIPAYEIRDVQDAVIERSTGDARAQFCVADALESLEIGKALVAKYPAIMIAGKLEGHAQHTGKHAAGVMVTNAPVVNYCSTDNSGASQIDKKDAEALNLLKIDALGLRVLSVIQDCLDQIGKDRDWLVNYPLTDEAAYEILNQERYAGIFQFEGYALQSLCRQMKVRSFDDLQVIGALARPGPLHCGAATQFIARRIGNEAITHMHPLAEPITRGTYGIVIYQEQVMAMGRAIGDLSWEDVSELRKAMSKSLGEEFFNKYWVKFEAGALKHGISSAEARRIWDKMCTFGSWAFNKSHSVSYGIISYWCCVLKAHHPLQFAAACLRNEKDTEQGVRILRDLSKEGFKYKPVDPDKSQLDWAVVDDILVGGLTNIKGIGLKKAQDILIRRQDKRPLLPGQRKLLSEPRTPYDDIFEGDRRFGDIYRHPRKHAVLSGKVWYIADIADAGEYVFLGKLKEKNLRDLNEYGNVVKRGGRLVPSLPLFLNLVIEDDTGSIICKVDRWKYPKLGKPLIEKAKIGDWFMFKGRIREDGWRMIMVDKWRCLEETSPLYKAPPEPPAPTKQPDLEKVTS